jgi:hypothetical protein
MKVTLALILSGLFLAPISTASHDAYTEVTTHRTLAANDGYTENFCKIIKFSSKISKKKCQDVVFMENKAKLVNFCQVAVINKKSVRKCTKFNVSPTSYIEPTDTIQVEVINTDLTQGELIAGVENPLGFIIDEYDRKGPVKYPNCKNLTYYIKANDEDKLLIKEVIIYIESIFGYKLSEVPEGRYIPGQMPESQEVRVADIVVYVDYGTKDVVHFNQGQNSVGMNTNTLGHDRVNGGWKINSSDVMLLSSEWYGNNRTKFRGVVLHEFGHAFGLGHPQKYLDSRPLMSSLFVHEGGQFKSGDLAGAQLLKNDTSKCK